MLLSSSGEEGKALCLWAYRWGHYQGCSTSGVCYLLNYGRTELVLASGGYRVRFCTLSLFSMLGSSGRRGRGCSGFRGPVSFTEVEQQVNFVTYFLSKQQRRLSSFFVLFLEVIIKLYACLFLASF